MCNFNLILAPQKLQKIQRKSIKMSEYESRNQYSSQTSHEVKTLSEKTLQDICNQAIDQVMGEYDSNLSSEMGGEDQMKSYGSSRLENAESPQRNGVPGDSPEHGDHINIESSPEPGQEWSVNQNFDEKKQEQVMGNRNDNFGTESAQDKSLSSRDKEILQEFRDAAPENEDRRGDHDRHQDFKTGSFNKGQGGGDGPYYSEAFSFSKDQVDPDSYPEHEMGESSRRGRPNYGGSRHPRDHHEDDRDTVNSNYVSMGDRDIDIGELSGFQQLKMKNQMMLSTSQIINYHK